MPMSPRRALRLAPPLASFLLLALAAARAGALDETLCEASKVGNL
jgi:hypothetical protein